MDLLATLPVSDTVRQALAVATEALRQHYGARLRRVVLFGSQARGEATQKSDVDVLVVLTDPVNEWAETRQVADIAHDILLQFGELIGFVVFGEQHAANPAQPLMMQVNREGIEL
jgi:predicted nucleotidyltransferase